jgi:prefoldin subunit 4
MHSYTEKTEALGAEHRLQDDKEQLEDLNMELELADEDEPVLYKIASSFYHLKPEQATEKVQKSLEALESEINTLEDEASHCKEKMDELKSVLYAKFGSKRGAR